MLLTVLTTALTILVRLLLLHQELLLIRFGEVSSVYDYLLWTRVYLVIDPEASKDGLRPVSPGRIKEVLFRLKAE